jgi:LPS sulfotransferase NodH
MIDIFKNIPSDKPVVVFSSYRTGSTALCSLLSLELCLPNLDELFHRVHDPQIYTKYKNQRLIIKVQPDQIIQPFWDELLNCAYIIGLTRRSLVHQISSFYCCHASGVWHQYQNQTRDNYEITWEIDDLEDQCRYIIDMNNRYCLHRSNCSEELVYEDISGYLDKSAMQRYIKPLNYSDLVTAVSNCLTTLGQNEQQRR